MSDLLENYYINDMPYTQEQLDAALDEMLRARSKTPMEIIKDYDAMLNNKRSGAGKNPCKEIFDPTEQDVTEIPKWPFVDAIASLPEMTVAELTTLKEKILEELYDRKEHPLR